MAERYPDPAIEGAAQAAERIVQLVSISAAGYQLYASRRAQAAQARAVQDRAAEQALEHQLRTAAAEARAKYAPAHDRRWLERANVVQVAEAWGAAVSYAATTPEAESAMRLCEGRLRSLHPHAMGHFDRARADGLGPYDAMVKAAPFFARDPNVREGAWPSRPALDVGTGTRWAANEHGPTREDFEAARKARRAEKIAERARMQERELRDRPGAAELRTVLDATTNLSDAEIKSAVSAYRSRYADLSGDASETSRGPAQVAADAFPIDLKTALASEAQQQNPRPAKTRERDRTRRPGM